MTFRSGFVTLVGRPNVGKSTLVNRIVGSKVAIVSDRPQTTRTQIRGVRTTPDNQMVLLDTPGIHKPRTLLGERTNERALATLAEVDVVSMLVEASTPIGRGDRFVAELVQQVDTPKILVVNKIDLADRRRSRSTSRSRQPSSATSTRTSRCRRAPATGSTRLSASSSRVSRRDRATTRRASSPTSPRCSSPPSCSANSCCRWPERSCRTRSRWSPRRSSPTTTKHAARRTNGTSRTTTTVLRIRARILVERESQKGIVIGRGGAVLKEAGTRARQELEALLGTRVYLETRVAVERDWQRRALDALDRLGDLVHKRHTSC